MTTTSPAPFPEDGLRKLSPKEMMQRAKALACTLPKDNKPTCSGQVFVGIFFDGTGNNRDRDYVELPPEKRKHSNIVRLFHSYRDKWNQGYLRYYIPGVGTPFPEIGDSGTGWSSTAGSAAAWKGENRIVWGLFQLLNAPHRFVHNNALLIQPDEAKTVVGNTASSTNPGAMRRVILNTWQDKLKAALAGKKPRVEQINLSVFGFSRGAAQARTFVNWLFEVCQQEDGGWTLAGIPLRLQFLGLFDTVASVGLANLYDTGVLAGHQSWADNTQEIHSAVERCVHFVAGHEVRACFPLDSVRVKSSYPGNAHEVMYPGAHSDVGGGYAPSAIGVSPTQDSFMATIPGHDMYREALKSGVPLVAWDMLNERFRNDLTPSSDVIRDFNAYLKDAAIGSGPVEEMARQHMSLYFSYRFKHRAHFDQRPPCTTAPPKDQRYLRSTQDCLIVRLSSLTPGMAVDLNVPRSVRQRIALEPEFDPPKAAKLHEKMWKAVGMPIGTREKHVIDVAKRIDVGSVKPGVEDFFDRYVHDSMAGFIGMGMDEFKMNGIGLAKFRTVFKGDD